MLSALGLGGLSGTPWGGEYNEWRFVFQAPWGRVGLAIAVAVAIAIVVLSILSARGERRVSRRVILAVLRVGTVCAALILFAQPAIQLENVTRLPNRVAVLVDQSASMSLSEKPGVPPRAARAAKVITEAGPAIDVWRERHHVDFYQFGGPGTKAVREPPGPGGPSGSGGGAVPGSGAELSPATQQALSATPARFGEGTRIREAIADVRARYEGKDLAGVVLVSDGIDHGRLASAVGPGGLDAEARDFLRGLDAPVHTVWTGRPGLRDLAVARVLADDFAFARNVVKVEAVVRVLGGEAWRGRRIPVTLRRDGMVVRSVEVTLDPDKPEQKIAFEFTPDRVGKYVYEVAAPVLEGDAIADNNHRVFMLKVIRDKVRVLLVAGRPSWDERFLRGLLKHNPNVDLISFFILRTPTDIEAVSPDEMSLIPFPTEELFLQQLKSFDLVFLQNFNYGPYGIGAYLGQIKEYVMEGGGLAMVGGDLSFTSGGYHETPVAEILPVELLAPAPEDKLIALDAFKMQLTAEGRGHPITALRLSPPENAARWAGLPPLSGCNLVAKLRPGGTALGVHPQLRGVDGKPLPVLAAGEFGRGRVLTFMSDSSWRWGFGTAGVNEEGDSRGHWYQRFWENAMRWLVHDPELRLLRIESDQGSYARGDKVRLIVRAFDWSTGRRKTWK